MKKASISVYLCLTLCIILSLIFACIDSVRYYCGRSAVACSMDEALFSLFSNYDKTLFEDYGILSLDGGYSGSQFKIGAMVDEVAENMDKVLSPDIDILGTDPENLYRISLDKAQVEGYVLLTDSNYQAIREQICESEIARIGAGLAGELTESLDINSAAFENFGLTDENELKEMLGDYGDLKKQADELKVSKTQLPGEAASDKTETEIPEDFVNPLENYKEVMSIGLYDFIIPADKKVSGAVIDTSSTVSNRSRNAGMGLMPVENHDTAEKMLMTEYAIDFFSNFRSEESTGDFKYQLEYIIAGKSRDGDNLKAVLNRLMQIREGLNYLYLWTDAEKQGELSAAAAIISSILLAPQYEEVVKQLLMLFWAYCESLSDMRTLLAGNKVPVFKDASTWKISIGSLGLFGSDTVNDEGNTGLSYRDYLRVLMYMVPDQARINRTMDMLEYNRREKEDNDTFCLDNCVTNLQILYSGTIGKHRITTSRSYGY